MRDYKKRSGYEIMMDILEASMTGANKTKIVYSAYLNFKQAKQYIEHLEEVELLREKNSGRKKIYQTTEKGKEVLAKYKDLESVISI
ncbi:MAG: DUF4364 family protein [Archaeoglobaceae archaeon]